VRESLYAVRRARASEARNSATALFPGQPKRLGAKSYGDDHGNDGRRLGHYPRSNLDRPTVDNAQKMQKSNQSVASDFIAMSKLRRSYCTAAVFGKRIPTSSFSPHKKTLLSSNARPVRGFSQSGYNKKDPSTLKGRSCTGV
jgi:hypothetical protein